MELEGAYKAVEFKPVQCRNQKLVLMKGCPIFYLRCFLFSLPKLGSVLPFCFVGPVVIHSSIKQPLLKVVP